MDTVGSRSSQPRRRIAQYADARVAYIRPFAIEGRQGYAIHAGDGTPIGWCENREIAIAAVRQQDLEPVSVH